MSLGKNTKTLRDSKGWEQKDLERESGVASGTISAIEVRNSKRSEHASALARAFGVPVEALLSDDVMEWLAENRKDQKTIRNTVNLSSGISEIPLLDRKTAGMHRKYLKDGVTPPALHNHPGKAGNLFAYQVDDDLMEPLVPFNSRAIISTRLTPKHGSVVLVEQDGVSVLRKLVIDGQSQLVETVKYQTAKPLTGTIIGVVHMVSILYADLMEDEE